MVLTPAVLFVSSFISYTNIIDKTNDDYHKKFDSLFEEFKNDRGYFSTQYYSMFFLRRLTYLLSQVYLNNYGSVQTGINIFFTLVQIVYLAYYVPLKENHIMVSVMAGEISGGIFIILSIFFLYDISAEISTIIELIMIYSVVGGMVIQFLVALYSLFLSLKLMWKKIIKLRAKKFLNIDKARRSLSLPRGYFN